MNILDKEQRLKELLETNIKNEKIGMAIAITGPWGVGKTFFWNKFYKNVTYKEIKDKQNFYYEASRINYESVFDCRKYAYISLFGIENLSDLKNTICTKLALNPHAKSDIDRFEFIQLLKNTLAQFRDVKVSSYGVSTSARVLESLLFLQVKNSIICFDDFERMSKNLDIKDVMGLANYLKLEKNCQIILILDEDKSEDENKDKYSSYKEKLVDETVILTSVEPLIRENTKGIDEQLVNLMIDFAEKLEIHNFRFFQKVIKLYQNFRNRLPTEVAYSTKEIILIRILQGFFIVDFGSKYGVKWNDFTIRNSVKNLINKEYSSDQESSGNIILSKLEKVSYLFVIDDLWMIEFKKWFEQRDIINFSELSNLANSELISENNNNNKNKLYNLMDKWRNLEVDEPYCNQIFNLSKELVGIETLGNLYFYSNLLKKFGRHDLSSELNHIVKKNILHSLDQNAGETIKDAFGSGYDNRNLFHRYLKYWQHYNKDLVLPNLFDVVSRYLLNKGWNLEDKNVLRDATKTDWEVLIWVQLPVDPRFSNISKLSLIKEIFSQQIDTDLTPQIKSMIFSILEEKAATENSYLKKNIEFLISILQEN